MDLVKNFGCAICVVNFGDENKLLLSIVLMSPCLLCSGEMRHVRFRINMSPQILNRSILHVGEW